MSLRNWFHLQLDDGPETFFFFEFSHTKRHPVCSTLAPVRLGNYPRLTTTPSTERRLILGKEQFCAGHSELILLLTYVCITPTECSSAALRTVTPLAVRIRIFCPMTYSGNNADRLSIYLFIWLFIYQSSLASISCNFPWHNKEYKPSTSTLSLSLTGWDTLPIPAVVFPQLLLLLVLLLFSSSPLPLLLSLETVASCLIQTTPSRRSGLGSRNNELVFGDWVKICIIQD